MKKKERNQIVVSNISIDSIGFKEAVNKIVALSQRKAFSFVVTPNVDHMTRLVGDECDNDFLCAYRDASLSLCDSRILEKILLLKGKKVKCVIPGSSLTKYLFDKVLKKSDKILVVGIEPHLIKRLSSLYPHLAISHINPTMGFIDKPDEVDSLIKSILSVSADYIFFSVGSPRQELLAQKVFESGVSGGVGLCVGASLLFMVGAERRAPKLFQFLHLEWAYRIFQNPKRLLFRYFKNFLALPAIIRSI